MKTSLKNAFIAFLFIGGLVLYPVFQVYGQVDKQVEKQSASSVGVDNYYNITDGGGVPDYPDSYSYTLYQPTGQELNNTIFASSTFSSSNSYDLRNYTIVDFVMWDLPMSEAWQEDFNIGCKDEHGNYHSIFGLGDSAMHIVGHQAFLRNSGLLAGYNVHLTVPFVCTSSLVSVNDIGNWTAWLQVVPYDVKVANKNISYGDWVMANSWIIFLLAFGPVGVLYALLNRRK